MITTPLFTRLMSPTEYGQFGVWTSWQSIITIIVSLSLSQGVHTQGLIKFEDERGPFSSSLQGLTTVCVIVWMVLYLLFQNFWNELLKLTSFQCLAMLVMIWTTAVFRFWANEQRVDYSYRNLIAVTLAVSVAKPMLELVLIINSEDKVTARILGLLTVEVMAYSWMYFTQLKKGKCFFSKQFWLYAIGFNIPLIPHYLSQVVLSSCDRIMIQRIIGDREAGIYNLAYSVSLIMMLFNTSLMQTISPWLYRKIRDKEITDIAPVGYISLTLIAGVNLILIALGPEVIRLFAPKEYYEAIWVIPPVAMSAFFMYTYDLFAKFAFYYEKTRYIMLASVFGALLNILLNYICLGHFGYIAAGYTTLICYIAFSFAHYCLMKKTCNQYLNGIRPYNVKHLLRIAIVFICAGVLLLFSYHQSSIRYCIIVVSCFSVICFRKTIMRYIGIIVNIKDSN